MADTSPRTDTSTVDTDDKRVSPLPLSLHSYSLLVVLTHKLNTIINKYAVGGRKRRYDAIKFKRIERKKSRPEGTVC